MTIKVEEGYYQPHKPDYKKYPVHGHGLDSDRAPTRFTFPQFCLMTWQMSKKNIHFADYKAKYGPVLRTLFNKGDYL